MKRLLTILLTVAILLTSCNANTTTVSSSNIQSSSEISSSDTSVSQSNSEVVSSSDIQKETPVVIDDKYKWDFTGMDDAFFEKELKTIQDELIPKYKKMVESFDNDLDNFYDIMILSDEIYQRMSSIAVLGRLKYDADSSNTNAKIQQTRVDKLYQDCAIIDTNFQNKIIKNDDKFWQNIYDNEKLKPWHYETKCLQESIQHLVTDEEIELIQPAINAYGSINSLYYTMYAKSQEFQSKLDVLNADEAQEDKILDVYNQYKEIFAQNYNSYVKIGEELAEIYHYDSKLDERLNYDGLTKEAYDILVESGKTNKVNFIRFAKIEDDVYTKVSAEDKTGIFKEYDEYIKNIQEIKYDDATNIIKKALSPLGKEYINDLEIAFNNRWIDVYPNPLKSKGAYSDGNMEHHPFILLNYEGGYYDISVLSHELGHAMNQYRSQKTQISDASKHPTSIVSEVASTTNEFLLYNYMTKNAKNNAEKLHYLKEEALFIDNAFFAQLMYNEFEEKVHEKIANDEILSADDLSQIFADIYNVFYDREMTKENIDNFWLHLSHLYSDYYVYNYSVAIAAACNVSEGVLSGDEKMLTNYKQFLSAGDSMSTMDMYKLIGVDLSKDDYIKKLIKHYDDILNQIETLTK